MSVLNLTQNEALDIWRRTTLEGVRRKTPDLTARQTAVLLSIYMTQPPHTVRDLAATLNISKPAITRALDKLSDLQLVRRKKDEEDRRSVLVQRTVKGSVFLTEFAELIIQSTQISLGKEKAGQ
ncbi:MAG: MarR family transcriptional regulator [Proteobacteria bacterium]|nr:MarR family transcriptional regulator [Pseudomonadota bacterium]